MFKRMILLTFLALTACQGEAPRSDEEVVRDRAQSRWDAVVAQDYQAAWAYYSPGFRETTDAPTYALDMARRPVRRTAATVQDVHCDGDRCEVTTRVRYRTIQGVSYLRGMELERDASETWIRIDGKWWYAAD